MSFIFTETQIDSPEMWQLPFYNLERPTDVHGKLSWLLIEMLSSNLLSNQLRLMLEIFDQKFQQSYPFNLSHEIDRDTLNNAAMDLCYFHYAVIHKAIEEYEGCNDVQDRLYEFEDELLEILKMIHSNAIEFHKHYALVASQCELEIKIHTTVEKILEIYNKIVSQMNEVANAPNEKLIAHQHECLAYAKNQAETFVGEAIRISNFIKDVDGSMNNLMTELGKQCRKVESLLVKMKKIERDVCWPVAEIREMKKNAKTEKVFF
jgi:hypothetical protein